MIKEEAYSRIDAIIAKYEIDEEPVTITSALDYDALRIARKALEEESKLDKIKGYVDHIRHTGMGKKKSLEFIEKFIEGLKADRQEKHEKELLDAVQECENGNCVGPFHSVEELMADLDA